MAEPEVNKLALFMEDMKARMKAMEQHTSELQERLDRANEENVRLRDASQKVENKADKAITFAADVSKAVTDNLVAPKPVEAPPSKLQPYKSGDFILWAERFNCQSTGWTEARKISELMNLLQGKAEDVVRSKKRVEWTSEDLLQACRDRLSPGYGITQIELELLELEENAAETPGDTMSRVEDITRKADGEIETELLNQVKRMAFMRLLKSHKPMYHYIQRKTERRSDPYEALKLAKQYIMKHGHNSQHIIDVTSKLMQKSGYNVQPISYSTILPSHQVGGHIAQSNLLQVPLANQVKFSSNPELSTQDKVTRAASNWGLPSQNVCHYQDLAGQDEYFEARYLDKGHEPTPEEINYRLNECERFRRAYKNGLHYPGWGNEVGYEHQASNSQRGSRGRPWRGRSSGDRGSSNHRGSSHDKRGRGRSNNERSRGAHSRGRGFGRSKPKGDEGLNAMDNEEDDHGGYDGQDGYDGYGDYPDYGDDVQE